jgi:hypothetical protein
MPLFQANAKSDSIENQVQKNKLMSFILLRIKGVLRKLGGAWSMAVGRLDSTGELCDNQSSGSSSSSSSSSGGSSSYSSSSSLSKRNDATGEMSSALRLKKILGSKNITVSKYLFSNE